MFEKDFSLIGFSGHGYTDFEPSYCIKGVEKCIKEITHINEKYKGKIEIFLGIGEDAFCQVNRSRYDYILGSSHYYVVNREHCLIDASPYHFQKCLGVFNHDIEPVTEDYYSKFFGYVIKRKPTIIGHFDLMAKFDKARRLLKDVGFKHIYRYTLRGKFVPGEL